MFLLTRHPKGIVLAPDPNIPWEREGVFNPGVIKADGEVIMLYRSIGENESGISRLGLAKSKDGVNFERIGKDPVFEPKESFDKWGVEDPRITKIEDKFYVTYVAVPERVLLDGKPYPRTGPLETSTALLETKDFVNFKNLGIISPDHSDNKDIVLFPRKIEGRYAMLHRPNYWHRTWCDHLTNKKSELNWSCELLDLPQFPAIWISWSDDLKHWADHKVVLFTSHHGDVKIGPGLPPIETPDGWLLIYHHVGIPQGYDKSIYSVRAALVDLKNPTKIISKVHYDILAPETPYEKEKGDIVFPTGGFVEGDTIYIYYGAGDKYIALATGSLSRLLEELKKNKETIQ